MAKQTITTIRYEADDQQIVWQSKIEKCVGETEVIVPDACEVVFVKDGIKLETMMPGRHTLNIPEKKGLFKKMAEKMKGVEDKGFDCKVYFVNKSCVMPIKWGTPNKLKLIDPILEYPINVGANGTFTIAVKETRKFIDKMAAKGKTITPELLHEQFSSELLLHIEDILANAMTNSKISYLDLSANKLAISKVITQSIQGIFDNVGVEVESFALSQVIIAESEIKEYEQILKNKKLLEMRGSSFDKEEQKKANNAKFAADVAIKSAEINNEN